MGALFIGLLLSVAGQLVIKAMITLGLSFVTYHYGVAGLENYVQARAAALPAQAMAILGFMGVPQAITMILSALVANATMNAAKVSLSRFTG